MTDYSQRLVWAKDAVTKLVCDMAAESDERRHRFGIEQMPGAIDSLNKAWDELTDCLVRQRDERDAQIARLMNELAEARKR